MPESCCGDKRRTAIGKRVSEASGICLQELAGNQDDSAQQLTNLS
jgi:hypothetical protein